MRTAAVLLASACGHPALRPPPAPGRVSQAPPEVDAAVRPTPAQLCTQLVAANALALASTSTALMAHAEPDRGIKLDALLKECVPGKDGVWTLALDDVNDGIFNMHGYADRRADDPDAVFARLALSYHYTDGRSESVRQSVFGTDADVTVCSKPPCALVNFTLASGRDRFDLALETPFDFDGDGTPEVTLHLTRGGLGEDPGDDVYTVWSMAPGKLDKFAPLADVDIERIEDFDGDGRPDIVVAVPYRHPMQFTYLGGCETAIVELPLLLHANEHATFRGDDPVALAFAAKSCAKLLAQPLKSVTDSEDGYRWAACQRLAGQTEDEVMAAFAHRCARVHSTDPDPCGGRALCDNAMLFQTAASLRPPLQFKP